MMQRRSVAVVSCPIRSGFGVPRPVAFLAAATEEAEQRLVERKLQQLGGTHRLSSLSGRIVTQGTLALRGMLLEQGYEPILVSADDDASIDGTAARLLAGCYDSFFISVFSALQARDACMLIRRLRQETNAAITVGGIHAAFAPSEFLAAGADFVVRGCAEDIRPWVGELMKRPSVPRSVAAGRACPSRLDWIDYDALPPETRADACVSMTLRTGCAFRCAFCVEWRLPRGPVAEANDVIALIDRHRRAFGHNHVFLSDAAIGPADLSVLEAAAQTFPDLYWHINVRAADLLDPPCAERLRRANVIGAYIGVESLSDRVLERNRKGFTAEDALCAVAIAAQHFPFLTTGLVAGLPGETAAEARSAFERQLQLHETTGAEHVSCRVFVPYPGSPAYERPEQFGLRLLTTDYALYQRYGMPVVESDGYSAPERYATFLRSATAAGSALRAAAGLPPVSEADRDVFGQDTTARQMFAWNVRSQSFQSNSA